VTNYFLSLKFVTIQRVYCSILRFYKLDIYQVDTSLIGIAKVS